MTTGEIIRKKRLEAGLTQKQLGERAGIAEPTIRKYESNRLNPKPATLRKLADALGVQWYSLMSDEWEGLYGEEAYKDDREELLDRQLLELSENGLTSNIDRLIVARTAYKSIYKKLNAQGQLEAFELLLNYSEADKLEYLLHDMMELAATPKFQKKPEE